MSRDALLVQQEILVEASPERVYRALTTPEELVRWWGVPGAYRTTDAHLDLEVGGRYRLRGTSDALGAFEVTGEYRVLEPPHRLVFTWIPDWDEDASDSVVSFELEPAPEGTRVVMRHTAFATVRSRDEHAGGWPAVLASLKAATESPTREHEGVG